MMKSNYKKILIVAAAMVAISASVGADNLLQNPGFEEWSGSLPTHWQKQSGLTVNQSSDARTGTYAVQLIRTSSSHKRFEQPNITVTNTGVEYTFKVYAKGTGYIRLGIQDGTASSDYHYGNYTHLNGVTDWQLITWTYTVTNSQVKFIISVKSTDSDGIIIDDAFFGTSGGANQPPTISNIQQSPSNPTSSDDVTVTADISDPDGDNIAKDSLWYRVFHAGSWSNWTGRNHTSTSPYTYTIPAQANHDSVEYYIIAEDDQGNRTESDHSVYYVSDDPIIQNVQQAPAAPTSSDVVTVIADITDPNNDLATDSLFYTTDGGTTYTQLYHSSVSGNTYTYEIPPLPDGTTVEYFIMAKDNDNNRVTSDTFSYTVQNLYPPVINEIMYNPSNPPFTSSDEWVEIYNPNDEPYDVSGWVFTDYEEDFTIPENTSIPAYGFLVIARDTANMRACAEYQDDLGSENDILLGNAGFGLSNGGEDIALKDNSGNVIDHVDYDDSSPWPTSPDGDGPSLELKDPSLDNNNGNNWAASSETYGTPGEPNSAYNDDNCVRNHDFESWGGSGPIGWDVEDGATATQETTKRRRGAKSAKIENTTAGKGLVQRFDVQQNASYDLRVWVYPSGSADNIRVFMIFTDGVGTVIDSIGPLTATETDKWQLIRRQGFIPAATQMYLKIRGYNTSKGVSGYVDDVYFQSAGATSVRENNLPPVLSYSSLRWISYPDRIQFIVPTDRPVELEVYSADGRKTRVIRGKWRLNLLTTNLKSGIYFALAKTDGRIIGKTKFIVVH